ncbi:MAG: 3-isopropylmalate dehydratase small subunit [Alphaproteobacteria bacterium]|jgi:3-isopropylmalate/(R)-2-methylmalate dehydratase small subunit|nr:3-isopropylmalate dehydratase small subunit [Rhodospirillaceae bacterium]MAG98236.1 3-isopropylmalate dehydratase small subunit [Rhodospirillaceae bacterium]MDP6406826.1 3-isopropylmalate dehydratase small subunit [Alphaproteobacteria bacterium]MDP6621670.1 3-isopropylmalate dehydratase small subunit [Alphaproteobacteria bacterium]
MEPFATVEGIVAPLLRDNIDTDAIIPAGIFKRIGTDMSRIGEGLFLDWRESAEGGERDQFILDRPQFTQAKVLLTGRNFGCGSSREHAVWALLGAGIRCVIAESYAEIFQANAFRKGLLPIALEPEKHARLVALVADSDVPVRIVVDLEACLITPVGDRPPVAFSVNPDRRDVLLRGLDEIDVALNHEDDIAAFQARDREARPWVYEIDFHEAAEDGE